MLYIYTFYFRFFVFFSDLGHPKLSSLPFTSEKLTYANNTV